jgi:hypothetical protein
MVLLAHSKYLSADWVVGVCAVGEKDGINVDSRRQCWEEGKIPRIQNSKNPKRRVFRGIVSYGGAEVGEVISDNCVPGGHSAVEMSWYERYGG